MKAETKAKRRVTLSICGLGFLDETEVETLKKDPVEAPKSFPLPSAAGEAPSAWVGDYTLQIGKNKGKRLKEVPPKTLINLANYFEDEQKKAPLKGFAKETLEKLGLYLEELKRGRGIPGRGRMPAPS
jgi:hypothetical protein